MSRFNPLTAEKLEAKALNTRTRTVCTQGHEDCTETVYTMAQQFRAGDKAHRMEFDHHSATDQIYAAAAPTCGSKKGGLNHVAVGSFQTEVTCGRCNK